MGLAQNFLARDWTIWSNEGIPGSAPTIWVSALSFERYFFSTSVEGTLKKNISRGTQEKKGKRDHVVRTEQKKKPAFFLLGEMGVIWSFPFWSRRAM